MKCYQIQDEFLIAIVAAQRCEIITKFLHYCETKIEKAGPLANFSMFLIRVLVKNQQLP